jgi:hypothetical protein
MTMRKSSAADEIAAIEDLMVDLEKRWWIWRND